MPFGRSNEALSRASRELREKIPKCSGSAGHCYCTLQIVLVLCRPTTQAKQSDSPI